MKINTFNDFIKNHLHILFINTHIFQNIQDLENAQYTLQKLYIEKHNYLRIISKEHLLTIQNNNPRFHELINNMIITKEFIQDTDDLYNRSITPTELDESHELYNHSSTPTQFD